MSTTAVIGFGILAWILVAILVALGVARVIKLRDRQRPNPVEPATPVQGDSSSGAVRSPTSATLSASPPASAWRCAETVDEQVRTL
jgi:hypothetical protein